VNNTDSYLKSIIVTLRYLYIQINKIDYLCVRHYISYKIWIS